MELGRGEGLNEGVLVEFVRFAGITRCPFTSVSIIEVIDRGPGIPPVIQELIYEPLFTTKADHGGTGVGLNTVKKIMHRAHGDISFRTSTKGTTFTVKWPLSN